MIRLHFYYCLIVFLCAACQNSSSQKKTTQQLNLSIHSEPPSLDPRRATDTTSISVITMCFEGLTRPGPEGKAILALAKEYSVSEDKKTYHFFLRDAVWSDGVPVTAYDFESTWRTNLDPNFPCEFGYDLYVLKNGKLAKENKCPTTDIGVKALDAHTLEIELEHPVPYLLELLASHSFLVCPSHITSKYSNWADHAGAHYIGNGPFKILKWRHSYEIILGRNETYWDADSVRLDRINLAMIEDENTELNMFENDQLDWAGNPLSSLPADALQALSKKTKLFKYPMSGTYYYVFNTKQFPFDNKHFRKAFSLAINRQEIIENITQSGQIPATGLVPPTLWKGKPDYFKDADVEEAKQYFDLALEEMRIKAEDLPEITLSYNTMQAHHKIAQAIQEQWFEAFGIRVKLQNKEWKVFLDELHHHQFQVARLGGIASFADPTSFLDDFRYENSKRNFSSWTNPQFSKLLEQVDFTIDEKERVELMKSAETILIDDMPIAPIYFYSGTYLKKSYVQGFYLTDLNEIDFRSAYIEKR
ncbi:MAG TPA: peptide ABC transporter substrate-binding protein [Rhabdochlamydiaceae bacterium]|nr:peptide ABC transporter substrate-binding protein [Rhabdochlamydiaceae bacterium]